MSHVVNRMVNEHNRTFTKIAKIRFHLELFHENDAKQTMSSQEHDVLYKALCKQFLPIIKTALHEVITQNFRIAPCCAVFDTHYLEIHEVVMISCLFFIFRSKVLL